MFNKHHLTQPPPGRLILLLLLWGALIVEGGCLLTGQPVWSLRLAILTTFLIMVLGVTIRRLTIVILVPLTVALAFNLGEPWLGFGLQAFLAALLTAALWPREPTPTDKEVPHG